MNKPLEPEVSLCSRVMGNYFGICYWIDDVCRKIKNPYQLVSKIVRRKPKDHKDSSRLLHLRLLISKKLGVKMREVWLCSLVDTRVAAELNIFAVVVYRRRFWCLLGLDSNSITDIVVNPKFESHNLATNIAQFLRNKSLGKKQGYKNRTQRKVARATFSMQR